MRTQATQKGISLIGFAIVLCVVGFFAYAAMKLIPTYMEYFGVVKSIKSLQTEPGMENMSIDEIRRRLGMAFDVQYVDGNDVPMSDITLITTNGQHSLRVTYDKDIPFIYNIDLLVHFDKTIDLSHGTTY